MRTAPKTLGQAMYVASELDRAWLQNEQRKLYTRSNEQPDYVFQKLWGQVTDLRNLRNAVARVARNRGHRTAGVDGLTVRKVLAQGLMCSSTRFGTSCAVAAIDRVRFGVSSSPRLANPGNIAPWGSPP
jgi:hypothetical protein